MFTVIPIGKVRDPAVCGVQVRERPTWIDRHLLASAAQTARVATPSKPARLTERLDPPSIEWEARRRVGEIASEASTSKECVTATRWTVS
jgi:hypothetical protein